MAHRKNVSLAPTPPLGWNSWNCFRCYGLNENAILGIADAMVSSGMRDAGYEYLVIDDCWQDFTRTSDGALRSNPERFPSGMAALGAQIHARGLKFGLYLAPGRKTCAMIYDRYPAKGIGSFGYEERDALLIADWGVDYLKYDWCRANRGGTGLEFAGAFEAMATAIQATGRDIVFSMSEYGKSKPWLWAGQYGHLWRTTQDIRPSWRSIMRLTDQQDGLAPYAGPSGWNDPDMLQVGNKGLSDIEARSHFMLWALLAAPLMAGNDLRAMTEVTRHLLTHDGILAISQDPLGIQGARLNRSGPIEVWQRPLATGHALGFLNRSQRPVTLSWSGDTFSHNGRPLGVVPDPVDVWTGQAIAGSDDTERVGHVGQTVRAIEWELAPHEMKLFTGQKGGGSSSGLRGAGFGIG